MVDIQAILDNDDKLTEVTKSIFDVIDRDGSGRIDKAELKDALVTVAQQANLTIPSDEEVQQAINSLDKDGSGNLDVNELKDLIRELLKILLESGSE